MASVVLLPWVKPNYHQYSPSLLFSLQALLNHVHPCSRSLIALYSIGSTIHWNWITFSFLNRNNYSSPIFWDLLSLSMLLHAINLSTVNQSTPTYVSSCSQHFVQWFTTPDWPAALSFLIFLKADSHQKMKLYFDDPSQSTHLVMHHHTSFSSWKLEFMNFFTFHVITTAYHKNALRNI